MSFAGKNYYNVYRIMLTAMGLWPFHKPNPLHTAVCFASFGSSVFFQSMILFTTKFDSKLAIQILSFIFPCFAYTLLYHCFYYNAKHIKLLLKQVETDWNTAGDAELKIFKKYARESRYIALLLAFFLSLGEFGLLIFEMVPVILDVVAPMNESRPRKIKVDFEMFLDRQQYFYVYLLEELVTVGIGFFTMASTGSLLLAFFRHSCANYKIASTSIENLVTKSMLEIPARQKTRKMYKKITYAVSTHRKAMQFTKFLINLLNKWLFCMIGVGVLSLSCNLLRLLISATLVKDPFDTIMCAAVVSGHFIAMLMGNIIGQTIIDHSTEIFTAAYNTSWYLAPLPIQKLLFFIMQYSLKANTLMVGGIFVASLEGFSTLATTSISYFTVLYNTN